MKSKLLNLLKCIHRANVAEIEEIKNLTITNEDRRQAEFIQGVCAAALAAYGVPTTVVQNEVLETAIAHLIRDLKDGGKTPSKLLISRIIHEVRESHKNPQA